MVNDTPRPLYPRKRDPAPFVHHFITFRSWTVYHVKYLTSTYFNQTLIRTTDFSKYASIAFHDSPASGSRVVGSAKSSLTISLLMPLATVSSDRLFCTHKSRFCFPFRSRQFLLRRLSQVQVKISVLVSPVHTRAVMDGCHLDKRRYIIWRQVEPPYPYTVQRFSSHQTAQQHNVLP